MCGCGVVCRSPPPPAAEVGTQLTMSLYLTLRDGALDRNLTDGKATPLASHQGGERFRLSLAVAKALGLFKGADFVWAVSWRRKNLHGHFLGLWTLQGKYLLRDGCSTY